MPAILTVVMFVLHLENFSSSMAVARCALTLPRKMKVGKKSGAVSRKDLNQQLLLL